ncbi:MAG: response regulator transcription factor, partial [Bacteroidetes bacterium]|nr:response regulator transcription factor [Bacteroidota bacterium]
ITDDHQLILDGLRSILEQQTDIKVISTANNGADLLRQLGFIKPDIVLMDIDMPIMNGIEATQQVKSTYPDIKIIMLTMHDEKAMVKKLTDIGACGFILKNSDKDELLQAIKRVHQGGKYFSSELTLNLISHGISPVMPGSVDDKKAMLTEREIEILKLIAEGLSNKEIGDKLFISHRTVDTHRTNLMKKLDVSNIAGLIRYAIKNGFID